jgi:5-methylcytosine-specific restriction enzyme subunit McrC
MYAYGRFWDAEKAVLLYPGDFDSPEFKAFKTDDFLMRDDAYVQIKHRCKMGYVSVLDPIKGGLDDQIGYRVLSLLEIQSAGIMQG